MKAPQPPRLDERRKAQFAAELQDRARAWIPEWGLADAEGDFGRALLDIAARFSSEVAERLDGAGEKMRRGFLDWLAVRGKAARPARMPVVFKLADTAVEGVRAAAPVRLQADADGTPVVFETEKDVRVIPGQLDVVVGVDADIDAFYLPPPGLNDLTPLKSLPTEWQLKSFAAAGVTTFQLEPEGGLLPGTVIEGSGEQYRIVKADKDLVTIDRPLVSGLEGGSRVTKVTTFAPFDGRSYNQQQHALYFGDSELLNIEQEARIEVVGSSSLTEGYTWQYWGKKGDEDKVDWQTLELDTGDKSKLVLEKGKGAIEEYEIAGKKSRWIRAFRKTIAADANPVTADSLGLRVNAPTCGDHPTVCPPATKSELPKAEGMANTTPLVLDNLFLPLGREPRQFDAFYLGSTEAFSKKGAQVRICFELADPTFESLAVIHRSRRAVNDLFAGVGKDGALHLFQFSAPEGKATVSRLLDRGPLRPPIPGDLGAVPTQTKPLQLNPKCRPVIRIENNDFFVEVASGGTIWIWHEVSGDEKLSGWKQLEPSLGPPDDPARIDDIVPVANPGTKVVYGGGGMFVHDGKLWDKKTTVDVTPPEPPVDPLPEPAPVTLAALAPVWEDGGKGLESLTPGTTMVGVSTDNVLYRVDINGNCTRLPLVFDDDEELVDAGTTTQDPPLDLAAMRPAALEIDSRLMVVTANKDRDRLVMYRGDPDSDVAVEVHRIELEDELVGSNIELSYVKGEAQFSVLCRTDSGATYIASWQPFAAGEIVRDILFKSKESASGSLAGPPATFTSHTIAPGARGDLFVARFYPFERHELKISDDKPDESGVAISSTTNPFVKGDAFAVDARSEPYLITDPAVTRPPDPESLYPVDRLIKDPGNDVELKAYRRTGQAFEADVDETELEIHIDDHKTVQGTLLLIEDKDALVIRRVVKIENGVAELNESLVSDKVNYWTPEAVKGRVAPIIRLDPQTSGTWPALIIEHAHLYFDKPLDPHMQEAKVFAPADNSHPSLIALRYPWTKAPDGNELYIIDATLEDWEHRLADTSSNPELSWEYSTGTAWESLILEEDGTLNFKKTGAIRFTVPDDIAAVDWSGKTNHWIRARLIGGDYGKEEITVEIEVDSSNDKKSKQTVTRDTKGIRPPVVVRLHISYGFCKPVIPALVLAEDSGTIRDQSDANRTPGAIVEAFVPLALTLGRLDKDSAPIVATKATPECPPECDCATLHPTEQITQTDGDATATPSSTRVTGRELYIGLTATPSEAPVNALLLVKEKDHSRFAPMSIEAFIADRFVPIVAEDKTRAVGESGLLSMTFAIPPTPSELFGRTLSWLRLKPKKVSEGTWLPEVRGAYLNGAWASATETLTRELLGSSNGEPHLTVRVGRPPVLYQTLELRVNEPLGEEERASLLKKDIKSVLSDVEGLPGDWVLWKQVVDPDDEPASARVYSLDENTGEIRFGDGIHGKIPPIGRDAIVAFSYSRTEPDPAGGEKVPGNSIAPRTELNLVSPIETVETVTAADQAAGGAPPESDDRVLRFGFARLRHRERAITAEDIEDLALQSSPDIVQVHAFLRRGYIRLVVVMRGKNPQPNAAQIRELRRLLLASAPVALSAPGALRIEPPVIRRLRVDLGLQIETLDNAGALTDYAKQNLAAFFDAATGGVDKDGWPLGINPGEADIALTLINAPYLGSITDVQLREITYEGRVLPSLEKVRANELVMLASDPVRIQFETSEVMV